MKRKLTAFLLTSALLAASTGCTAGAGKTEEKTAAATTSATSAPVTTTSSETESTTAETTAATTEKEKDTVSITAHPMDGEYFSPATDDWFLYSENGCSIEQEEIEKDCTEMQTLYSFKPDGSLAAQAYKLVYKTDEAAHSAFEFMPDYPFQPAVIDYAVAENVLYFSTGCLTYDKKSRFIERMQDDGLVKDLGNGIFGYVMGGGAVWSKYQFSKLDSGTVEND